MDERELALLLEEKDREIELLKEEVGRLKARLAKEPGLLTDMLARRGLKVYRKEHDQDVVRPASVTRARMDEFYRRMNKYSFRLFLRDVIKHQDGFRPEELVRYSSLPVVNEYTGYLAESGILEGAGPGVYRIAGRKFRSFGPTLEWYVSEVFRREYAADTVWGVRFKKTGTGGDYDVIAALEGRLVYAEVKSSPPKQIYENEVRAFINRESELSAELSLFIVDTELRMKDKVVVLFEQVLPDTPLAGASVERFRDEIFKAGDSLFIVNSKNGLAANIGRVLGWHLKRRADAG